MTPQSAAEASLRACRSRLADYDELKAREKAALQDAHKDAHGSAYTTPGCRLCEDKQALRGNLPENDLAFKVRFALLINPCMDKVGQNPCWLALGLDAHCTPHLPVSIVPNSKTNSRPLTRTRTRTLCVMTPVTD